MERQRDGGMERRGWRDGSMQWCRNGGLSRERMVDRERVWSESELLYK